MRETLFVERKRRKLEHNTFLLTENRARSSENRFLARRSGRVQIAAIDAMIASFET
jgi:hypothetical protein